MNNYNGSKQHLQNLQNARNTLRIHKAICQYCENKFAKGNVKKHELSCYLNPLKLKLCIVCNKPIKNYKFNTTCSYSCSNTYFRSGPDHGNWKEDAYRSTCFNFHKKKCVVCGESNIVTVHHMDENNKNNKPENLIPLCPTHHQYWHSRYKSLVEEQINFYIKNWSFLQGTILQPPVSKTGALSS